LKETDVQNIEDELRRMFAADSDAIRESDLRPAAAFPTARARRTRRLSTGVAMVAAAVATTAVVLGPRLVDGPRESPSPAPQTTPTLTAAPSPDSHVGVGQPIMHLVLRPVTVDPPGVTAQIFRPTEVSVAGPRAAPKIMTGIEQEQDALVATFRARAAQAVRSGVDPGRMSLRIDAPRVGTWSHFLSVRLDITTALGQPNPLEESTVLMFDTTTGERILFTDVFTDVEQADAVVREALQASRPDGSLDGHDLSAASLAPTKPGSTDPLACYPYGAGLDCILVRGGLTPYESGRIEAVVGWERFTGLLRPGMGK
jgi:hypothetical protein